MRATPAPASPPPHRWWANRYVAVYVGLATAFVAQVGRFHDPRTGFTSLLAFGEVFQPKRLVRLRDVPIYTYASTGYDGQFYSQLAVAGNPLDPELQTALDSVPYRTRRVLLPLLAHLAGLGKPAWVLQAFALANAVCWLALALLLARWWFPPTDVQNLLRWAGTLFGVGMLASVRYSLTDGPALLCLACGARLLERNRDLAGAAVLGAAGLVREMSVLCVAAFLPRSSEERCDWHRRALAAALCALPILIWAGIVTTRHGSTGSARNFDLPLVSYVTKLAEIRDGWRAHGWGDSIRENVWEVIALGTQVGFVLTRPQPGKLWWRIGAAFSALWLCLGWAVWEGPLSAASRAVLPLTLAFNVLAPRTRKGIVLVAAGNLTVLSYATVLAPPAFSPERTVLAEGVSCSYADGWYATETLEGRIWRWAPGPASLLLQNTTAETQVVTLEFQIVSVKDRTVTVRAPGVERSFTLRGSPTRLPATFGPLRLPRGDTTVVFTSAEAPWPEKGASGRRLAFSVENLHAVDGEE